MAQTLQELEYAMIQTFLVNDGHATKLPGQGNYAAPDYGPGDPEFDQTFELIQKITGPVDEHIRSFALDPVSVEATNKIMMAGDDPIADYLGTKIDDDTIKYNPSTFKLYVNSVPLATASKVGGVQIGAQLFLYMQGNNLMLNTETSPLLVGGNNMVPTSRAVKLYVDAALIGSGSGGDMFKSTYDTGDNGVVDDSEQLNNQPGSYYLAWANFTGQPTTLSGYGITDAYTMTAIDAFFEGESLGKKQVDWARITSKPVIPIVNNGTNDRVVTSTGGSDFYCEGNLIFDGNLLTVTGDVNISDVLTVDIINEYTGDAGVTIDGVLLKNNDVIIPTANYVYFNVGLTTRIYDDAGVLTFYDSTSGLQTLADLVGGGGMVYPGVGIALSTGSAWGTSITDNSATWNAAQPGHANLTSLAGLTYVSTSFVKMTGANTFSLDVNTYGPVPTDDILDWSTDKYIRYAANADGVLSSSSTKPTTGTSYLTWSGTFQSRDLIIGTTNEWFSFSNSAAVLGKYNDVTRLYMNLGEVDGAAAVAYFMDTHNALITAGAKLFSVRNQGSEKFYIDKDGVAKIVDIYIGSSVNTPAIYKYTGSGAGSSHVIGISAGLYLSTTNTIYEPFDFTSNLGSITAQYTLGTFNLSRGGASVGYEVSGPLIDLYDSMTFSGGSVTGRVLQYRNFTDTLIYMHPNVVDGVSAIGYLFDTMNALTTSGAKLVSVLNNQVEKFFIDKDGNVDIEAGAEYRIDGVAIPVGDVEWGSSVGTTFPLVIKNSDGTVRTDGNLGFHDVDTRLYLGASGSGYEFSQGIINYSLGESSIPAHRLKTGATWATQKLLSVQNNTSERFFVNYNGAIGLNLYGSGTFSGSATYTLQVDASGNIIEGVIGGTVTSVAAGNGMDFTTITGSGSVIMGTPTTLTATTTNSVSGTTHEHAITGFSKISGTPVITRLALWTNATTIGDDSNLTYASDTLSIAGTSPALELTQASGWGYVQNIGVSGGLRMVVIDSGSNPRTMFEINATSDYVKLNDGTGTTRFLVDSGGVDVTGDLTVSAQVYMDNIDTSAETVTLRYTAVGGKLTYPSSDIRLKENIVDWDIDALYILTKFSPKQFEWKNDLGRIRTGWIAQEGKKHISDMFPIIEKTGMYSLAEFEILPYFHIAINQLDVKVETHEEKIIRLEERIEILEQQLVS